MKKAIFIFILFFCISFDSLAQLKGAGYFDGYWSNWVPMGDAKIHGNYDGFILYVDTEGPWEYRFKLTVNNMVFPNKKQRKKDIKDGKWYEFTGTVEFYTTNAYPTILSIFRAQKGIMFAPAKLKDGRSSIKMTSRAKIKIAPFKDLPEVYNIWFDNVGVGIDLNGQYFPNVEFK